MGSHARMPDLNCLDEKDYYSCIVFFKTITDSDTFSCLIRSILQGLPLTRIILVRKRERECENVFETLFKLLKSASARIEMKCLGSISELHVWNCLRLFWCSLKMLPGRDSWPSGLSVQTCYLASIPALWSFRLGESRLPKRSPLSLSLILFDFSHLLSCLVQ